MTHAYTMQLPNPAASIPGVHPQPTGQRRHPRTGWSTASLIVGAPALALTILFPFLHLPVAGGIALAAVSVLFGVLGLVLGILGVARSPATPPTGRPRAVLGIVFGSMTLLLWIAGLTLVYVAISNLHFSG